MASVDVQILQEKANFTRLSRLLVDKGTEALRSTFDTIHSPANLSAVLAANRISLLRLKPRVINNSQWDLLYPPSGNPPDSKTFDVTLLTVLFRNICSLPSTGWGVMPPDTDRSLQANITRIKLFRNEVYAHVTSTQVDNATFQSLWQKISQALVELNVPQHYVDELKTSPLSPEEDISVKMLEDWKLQEDECMKMLEGLNNEVQSIKVIVEENQAGIKQQSDTVEAFRSSLKHTLQVSEDINLKKKFRKESDEDILRNLAKHNFKGKIKSKVKFFMPGTRKWLFEKVEKFVENEHESRMLLLTAGPGFGKSVFAAKVCEDYKKKGTLAALHFCDFNNSNLRDPMVMLQSLASQMCENVEGFKDKLLDQLKRPHQVQNLKDAFGVYLQNPLDELELKESCLVVIDGLDESAADKKNEIVDLIGDCFQDLPECIKILVTSRPEISIAKLSRVQTIDIKRDDNNNSSDLKIYFKASLPSLADRTKNVIDVNDMEFDDEDMYVQQWTRVYDMLVDECEGSFLYAFYIESELKKRDDLNTMPFIEIFFFVPEGIGSIYQAYFKRLEVELKQIKHENVNVLRILEILAVSEEPLPLTFVARAIGLAPDCRETISIINKVNETISCLLYVSNDEVTVFHKSIIDWLLAKGYKVHEYTVNVSDANKSLWLLCEQNLEEIKTTVYSKRCFEKESLSSDSRYALDHGFRHLAACKMGERFFWLVDVIIIYNLLPLDFRRRGILYVLREILQDAMVLSKELRARISWHVVEIEFLENMCYSSNKQNVPFFYLHSVFTHSPKGCFSDEEKKIAELLSSKIRQFVEFNCYDVEIMPLGTWKDPEIEEIIAVGISHEKTMAAIAFKNGRTIVLSVPSLVELWSYRTEYKRICCCIFAPGDSFVLFGKLKTALSIAERKELPFFHGIDETFVCGAFSPSGNRLVTCDNSRTVKLWDVSRQSLLSLLDANVHINWCTFSSTGLFIIGDRKCNIEGLAREDSESDDDDSRIGDFEYDSDGELINWEHTYDQQDSFCVWNAITWQRGDERNLADELGQSQSRKCKRFLQLGLKGQKLQIELCAMSPRKKWFVGMYDGAKCIFVLHNHSLKVKDFPYFSNIYEYDRFMEIAATVDDLLFCANRTKFTVFKKFAATGEQTLCFPRLTLVLWSSFSPDGSRLATCVSGGYIKIWDVYTSQVKQHFHHNCDESLTACWWSEKFLFVFEFVDGAPSLSRFPVYNLKILFSQNQQISLCHLVNDFEPLSSILDFSENVLSFECGETKPVKVLDVNGSERPQMITLPRIRPMINITVSPGASFIFGGDRDKYFIWKRNVSKEPGVYDLLAEESSLERYDNFFVPYRKPDYTCCFSNDSRVAVVAYRNDAYLRCDIIDLITGNCQRKSFYDTSRSLEILPFRSQLFCVKNNILIVASEFAIRFFDMDSGVRLASSFQPYLTWDLRKQTKVSPKENVMAFSKVNGDMVFVRLCIP